MDNSGNRKDLTSFQMAMIWLIAILFSLFVLLFVPDVRTIIEVLVVIIVSIVIVIVGIFFVDNLFLLYNIGQWKGILCTSMVFLLVPAIMSVAYFLHLHDYMTSIPEDNRVAFCIFASIQACFALVAALSKLTCMRLES